MQSGNVAPSPTMKDTPRIGPQHVVQSTPGPGRRRWSCRSASRTRWPSPTARPRGRPCRRSSTGNRRRTGTSSPPRCALELGVELVLQGGRGHRQAGVPTGGDHPGQLVVGQASHVVEVEGVLVAGGEVRGGPVRRLAQIGLLLWTRDPPPWPARCAPSSMSSRHWVSG